VRLSGISEKLGIFSAKHRSWSAFDRVACLAERGEDYFCNVRLPEIERASPAVFYGLGRKRSHLASAEMVRAELERFKSRRAPPHAALIKIQLPLRLQPRLLKASRASLIS